jgi:hypothetical protein
VLKPFFADFQVRISDTEGNLQKAAGNLNRIIRDHSLTLSLHKTKLMAFKGRDPDRNKMLKVKVN